MTLDGFEEVIEIEIAPQSKIRSEFELTLVSPPGVSEFEEPALKAIWKPGSDSTRVDDKTTRVTVSAMKSGFARLQLQALRYGNSDLPDAKLRINVRALTSAGDSELAKLDGVRNLDVRLPVRDQIHAIVTTRGISEPIVSSEDSLPNGAWLRTFASRETTFTLQLFNQAKRSVRARIWLVAAQHPFADDGIREYRPEVLVNQISRLERQLLGSDQRVLPDIFNSRQLLKGPVDVTIGDREKPGLVNWAVSESEEESSSAGESDLGAVLADATEPSEAAVDVSHGMGLVVRLIDEEGRPLPGEDQVVWLIPKPRAPETYVEIESIDYRRGLIEIAAQLKKDIDGDGRADEIPGIQKSAVQVAWTENDQWQDFEFNSTQPLDQALVELKPVASRDKIVVSVPITGRDESLIQLDVDSWPRAMLRSISHREGAKPRLRNRYDRVQFSSVSMDYADRPLNLKPEDKPIGNLLVHYPSPSRPVIYRGSGQRMAVRFAADLTADFFKDSTPPEIFIDKDTRYWSDRAIRTTAVRIDDTALTLLTRVSDLELDMSSFARRADAVTNLQAALRVRNQRQTARVRIILDSTRPRIQNVQRQPQRIEVGQQIYYGIIGSDPSNRAPSSGLAEISIGRDDDGDGKPDKEDPRFPFETGEINKRFNAPPIGRHAIVMQAWDKAGWASEPEVDSLQVMPKPVKAPTPPPPEMAKEAPAAEPVKRGPLEGRIDSRQTWRGKLTLSPVPDEVIPESGVIQVGRSRPTFRFQNVPEGKYKLEFKGFVGGVEKTATWEALNIGKTHVLPPD